MTDTHEALDQDDIHVGAPNNARDAIQQARALIPVGPSGAVPQNFAQQADFAKTMALARAALPKHLAGSPGDCLAIIDIASRANLSPFMVANATYVGPDGRLAFESKLHHAFLIQSGLIVGDFDVNYSGDGDELTCTVSAKLRSDGKVRSHTSPPLGKVRPPTGDKGFIKGSPLWIRKPLIQIFYDTSRDWIRMYAPTATLGIFAPEEFVETPIGPDAAKDVTGTPDLKERIAGPKGEGFKDGHAAMELDKIAASSGTIIDGTAAAVSGPADAIAPAEAAKVAADPETKPATPPPGDPAPSEAKATPKGRGNTTKATPATAKDCDTVEEYTAYTKAWIDAFDGSMLEAQGRFDDDFKERRRLKAGTVAAILQRYLDDHFAKVSTKKRK